MTGEAARNHVQQTRKRVAAICVGIGTVLADDPMLTCRCENPSQPVRVVLDTRLRIPMESKLVQTAGEVPVIVFCHAPDKEKKAALEQKGVTVLEAELLHQTDLESLLARYENLPVPKEHLHGRHISLRNCLEQLGQRGLDSILIEGGASIHAAALQEGCCDRCRFMSPKLFGGDGLSPIGMGITTRTRQFFCLHPR
ncbi:MAG: RibD family protein [Ruminococcus sp.]